MIGSYTMKTAVKGEERKGKSPLYVKPFNSLAYEKTEVRNRKLQK
jgi:hypothetical protein